MTDALVRLIDGRLVDRASEDWRHECEARAILAMPTKQERRAFLYGGIRPDGSKTHGVLGLRGEREVKRLEATMLLIWNSNRPSR